MIRKVEDALVIFKQEMKIYLSECKKNWGNKCHKWQRRKENMEHGLNGMIRVLNLSGKDIMEIRSRLEKESYNG